MFQAEPEVGEEEDADQRSRGSTGGRNGGATSSSAERDGRPAPQRPRAPPKSPAGRKSSTRTKSDEDHQLLERAGQERGAERLGQPDDEAAQQGAEEVAHAAEHHDHEGHDVERLADVGRDVEERRDQRAGHRHAAPSRSRRRGSRMRAHVDAHQQRALRLLGQRADGLADVRAAQEGEERQRHERRRRRTRSAAAPPRAPRRARTRRSRSAAAPCGSRPARARAPGSRGTAPGRA